MKTIIMTGATSFLGRNLLRGLLEKEYTIYLLVRPDSPSLGLLPHNEKIRYLYGSLDELTLIKEVVTKADYFIHFAWEGSGYAGRANNKIQQRNIKYSVQALFMADALGCSKFIFSGSQAEYGRIHGCLTEDVSCAPVSEYGKAKMEFAVWGECFCRNRSLAFIHLRIFSVYGLGDRPNTLVDVCIRTFHAGGKISLGPCNQKWNFLYINDFVHIVLVLLELGCGSGIYNIASKDTRILREFVEEMYQLSDRRGTYEFGEALDHPEGSPELEPCIDKLAAVLGEWKMTAFRDGVRSIMNKMEMEERK